MSGILSQKQIETDTKYKKIAIFSKVKLWAISTKLNFGNTACLQVQSLTLKLFELCDSRYRGLDKSWKKKC